MPKKVVKNANGNKKTRNGKSKASKSRADPADEVMLKSIRKVGSQDLLDGERKKSNSNALHENEQCSEEHHDLHSVTSFRPQRRTNRCVCVIISALLLLIFSGAVVILILLFLMVGERQPKVHTDCGVIEGEFDSTTKSFSFKGIPYAEPPVQLNRWQHPKPLVNSTCWKGVLKAVNTPPECAQRHPNTQRISGSEDCLYLNVFTPAIDPLKLVPVMVYIHGGNLQWGNASVRGYCPDANTAVNLDVVFVNIQYRLNAFGWMVTEAQTGGGNYGLLDQIAALTWIKKNIRKFGGDPDKITLFGQNSGATSVFALLTSPRAKGLFSRAWMLSPSPRLDTTLEEARAANQFFLQRLNCSTETCLLRKGTEEVLEALYPQWDHVDDAMTLPREGERLTSLIVIDGDVLPKSPFDAWDEHLGFYSDVPLVVGSTAQEVDLRPTPGESLRSWGYEELYAYVSEYLGTFGDPTLANRTLALYGVNGGEEETSNGAAPVASREATATVDAELVLTSMATDVRVTCGANRLAAMAATALTAKVYRYVVTAPPSRPARPPVGGADFAPRYAFHSWDAYAFFDSFSAVLGGGGGGGRGGGGSEADQRFGRTLRDNLLHFVETGAPRDWAWEKYPPTIALIGESLRPNKTYSRTQCELWSGDHWFQYSWAH